MKIKRLLSSIVTLAAITLVLRAADNSADTKANVLTEAEKAAGWKLLFDGKSLDGWHGYKKKEAPKAGWVIEDGWLKCVENGHGGDLVSIDEFDDFEFSWDWRIPAKANNGIKYFITEERNQAVGHEYQMIDDTQVKDAKYSTASFYDVLPPSAEKPLKKPGEVNHSSVLVRGNHVEHWLNGAKVLEYELGSDTVKNAVAKSKFKNVAGFGTKIRGHILLTEHHDEASFRNVKIRALPAK
jgi:hypothetical protein